MHTGLKYITFEGRLCQEIVMFSATIQHINVAFLMNIDATNILGAGFVTTDDDGQLYCGGESTSLGVKSRPEADTTMLRKQIKQVN